MPYKDPNSPAAKASSKRRSKKYYEANKDTIIAKRSEYMKEYGKEHHQKTYKTKGRDSFLKITYKITLEQYNQMIIAQGGLCLACKEPLEEESPLAHRGPVVDHDHTCCPKSRSCGKCVRGIIHRACNVGIGMFGDNAIKLRLAAEYLEKSYVR
jgi:hypothetical protein